MMTEYEFTLKRDWSMRMARRARQQVFRGTAPDDKGVRFWCAWARWYNARAIETRTGATFARTAERPDFPRL